ncbi:MAG TPA: alpha/beta fold hydrolase [Jatrophihabitantaceae bacterium]|jgi:proline iminopeptidase
MVGAVESLVAINGTSLFTRAVGDGDPLIVLHGGPEFDSFYLMPELDVLEQCGRLIYYDQRGRGRSSPSPARDVTIDSEVADLEALRQHLGAGPVALLGHSWGGVLAMEYAARHPDNVSRLVLLNTAPASNREWREFLSAWRGGRSDSDAAALTALTQRPAYAAGEVAADTELYRIVFRTASRDPQVCERIVSRLRAQFTPAKVVDSRVIEDRLQRDTLEHDGYDIASRLSRLRVPTLVVHGAHDFVPVRMAERIAASIPGSRLEILPNCGHFCYAERPTAVRDVVCGFLHPHRGDLVIE